MIWSGPYGLQMIAMNGVLDFMDKVLDGLDTEAVLSEPVADCCNESFRNVQHGDDAIFSPSIAFIPLVKPDIGTEKNVEPPDRFLAR